ncbi:MAG: hypothetical protein ABIO82_01450 [Ginsengibacter sp.]
MNLVEKIQKEHSKENCYQIVSWVGNNQVRFDQLFKLFLEAELRVTQRASWPFSYAAIAHPGLMKKHFERLLANLNKPALHGAVKRNTLRFLKEIEIPERHHGAILEKCFHYLESQEEEVAIKSFALEILSQLAKKYPEIIPEIKILIEDQIQHQKPAFKSTAKKFLAAHQHLQ